jgi:hypothetical protein
MVVPMIGSRLSLECRGGWTSSTSKPTEIRPASTREAIGGRRLRRDGGILLLQRKLTLEIGDPLRLLLELFVSRSFSARSRSISCASRSRVSRVGSSRRDSFLRPRAIAPSTRAYEITTKSTSTKPCQVSEGVNCYYFAHHLLLREHVQSPRDE